MVKQSVNGAGCACKAAARWQAAADHLRRLSGPIPAETRRRFSAGRSCEQGRRYREVERGCGSDAKERRNIDLLRLLSHGALPESTASVFAPHGSGLQKDLGFEPFNKLPHRLGRERLSDRIEFAGKELTYGNGVGLARWRDKVPEAQINRHISVFFVIVRYVQIQHPQSRTLHPATADHLIRIAFR